LEEHRRGRPTVNEGNDTYLNVEEAAKLIGVSPNTIREWIKRGRLPGYHPEFADRPTYVKKVELENFSRMRRLDPPSHPSSPDHELSDE